MYKVILDPNLFECEESASEIEQTKHFLFLKNCISFLADYCNVCMDCYEGAPYYYKSPKYPIPPITNSHYMKINYNEIRKKIFKLQNNCFNAVEINSLHTCKCIEFKFINNSECMESFLKYLNHIQKSSETNCVVILGINNICDDLTVTDENDNLLHLEAIYDVPADCSQKVGKLLALSDKSDLPFPYCQSCFSLNESFLQEEKSSRLNSNDKVSIMRKYGAEFASRNQYIKNNHLSKNNPKYVVFTNDNGNYAISIDQEHGGLELFAKKHISKKYPNGKRSSYEHLGEYNYSGKQTKDAEPTNHILFD